MEVPGTEDIPGWVDRLDWVVLADWLEISIAVDSDLVEDFSSEELSSDELSIEELRFEEPGSEALSCKGEASSAETVEASLTANGAVSGPASDACRNSGNPQKMNAAVNSNILSKRGSSFQLFDSFRGANHIRQTNTKFLINHDHFTMGNQRAVDQHI